MTFASSVAVAANGPPGALAANEVVVEVTRKVEQRVEPRLVRQLVALEVADIDVPASPSGDGEPPALFFRLLELGDGAFRVELWERGEFHGARRIAGEGSRQLQARRIALSAGVLARGLRRRRLLELRNAAEPPEDAGDEGPPPGAPVYARFALDARGGGAVIGPSHAWLVGPTLGGDLRFDTGPALGLGLSWLGGASRGGSASTALRWVDVSLTPSYRWALGAWDVALGITVAGAIVRADGLRRPGNTELGLDAWSARSTGHFRLEGPLGDGMRWSFGPEVGAAVRRLVVETGDGDRRRLGGMWLGASLGLVVDPGRDRLPVATEP